MAPVTAFCNHLASSMQLDRTIATNLMYAHAWQFAPALFLYSAVMYACASWNSSRTPPPLDRCSCLDGLYWLLVRAVMFNAVRVILVMITGGQFLVSECLFLVCISCQGWGVTF